jgi:hypothetical protein
MIKPISLSMSIGDCVHKNPKSLHKHKINHHLPYKHLHQLKMRNWMKKKKIKFKTMSQEGIDQGGDEVVQEKEDEQEIQDQRPPHPRVHQAIQRDHPVNSILGDIQKGVTTRSQVAHFCEHYTFVSSIEPYRIKMHLEIQTGWWQCKRSSTTSQGMRSDI